MDGVNEVTEPEMFSTEERSGVNEVTEPEMFSPEEASQFFGFKKGQGYVEVMCGITTRFLGDYGGRLKVFANGHLEVTCRCYKGCPQENISPAEFERHSTIQNNRTWRNNIWVVFGDDKVPLSKTSLLKYYVNPNIPTNEVSYFHRDEFIQCNQCKKMRRFHLRNKEECRTYHDALANVKWKCSDQGASCNDREKRTCRRSIYRGCFRSLVCSGCESCVCFGCKICRFQDCDCRTCVDYYESARDE